MSRRSPVAQPRFTSEETRKLRRLLESLPDEEVVRLKALLARSDGLITFARWLEAWAATGWLLSRVSRVIKKVLFWIVGIVAAFIYLRTSNPEILKWLLSKLS